jgi:threonine dehydratase
MANPTSWPAPTLADVLKARRTIAPYLRATPILESAALSRALGCRAVLKCENLNPTGAFKVRGGVNLLASMEPTARARGVVAASTGNHGQSVAYAASLFGTRATIFMPEGANPLKVAATLDLGADVVQNGVDFDAARLAAEEFARCQGLRYVHSANEPLLVAGVGTATLELLEAVPDLDVLFVPVGAGSGALGAGTVARAVNPAIRVIGVQAVGAPAVYHSWREGRRIVTSTVATFAEGLATREPFEMPLAFLPRLVDEIVLVSDDELASAIRLLIETTRQIAEGAGAAALAAAFAARSKLAGRNIGLIISGGNITSEQLRKILDHDAPQSNP